MAEHAPILQDHEDPLPGPTFLIGFIGAVLVFVITFGLTGLYYGERGAVENEKFMNRDYTEITTLDAEQFQQLNVTRYEDRDENGTPYTALVIPIDRAMAKIADQY